MKIPGVIKITNVSSLIVPNGLCSGCGVCAGVCPAGNLVMEWNSRGEYNPVDQGRCIEGCTRCLEVCPFFPGNPNEDQLTKERFAAIEGSAHTPEAGWWLACFAGAVADDGERSKSASGGLASWTLSELLRTKTVDEVICAEPNDDPNKLFRFASFNDQAILNRAKGSAYYPVELSGMLRHIKATDKKFVITGLPCLIKALRLACSRDKTLKQKMPYLIGITCGQMKSRKYTGYIASLAGVNEPLSKAFFRGKRSDAPAIDYNFVCKGVSGKEGKISWTGGVSKIWGERWFNLEACGCCDDIFAETADAVFMDAWLPEYVSDSRGTSLTIIRNPGLLELFQQNPSALDIHFIDVNKVIRSQRGVITNKRSVLAYRLAKRPKAVSGRLLEKRVAPDPSALNILSRRRTDALDAITSVTATWDLQTESAEELRCRIAPELKKLQSIDRALRIIMLPRRIAGKLLRMIRGVKL